MPNIVLGQQGSGVSMSFGSMNVERVSPAQKAKSSPYSYEYPKGLDFRPGSELHERIKASVLAKARASQDVIKTRFSSWREIDRTLTTYISLDEEEKEIVREDKRKPVSVVVPVSYATLETLLTYLTAAFLDEPYFRYEGAGPEDVLGAILLEMVVAQQCRRSKAGLELHTGWRDGLTYGFGPMYIGWEKKTGYRTSQSEEEIFSMLRNEFVKTGSTTETMERVTTYEGGKLTALDPYMCLPDPDVPIQNVQDGSFFGWIERRGLMSWLELERDNNDFFNMKYLKHFDGRSTLNTRSETGRGDKYGMVDSSTFTTQPVDVINMFVKLIPKDAGIGDEEYPETWLFALAGDEVIVRAQPLGLDHNQFPVSVASPDSDGHSIIPISRLETVHGLQTTLDWLFQSHITNVRKSINDMLVVDPMLVNIHDIANPKPGGIIRTRRRVWGRGVKDVVMQLGVVDVTSHHIPDSGYITQLIRETTGSQDAIAGIRRKTSERVSATEAAGTMRSALSRLEKMAKMISLQMHYDIAYQLASNTRQLMSEERYAKIVGDWGRVLAEDFGIEAERDRVLISPRSINVEFDVIPHDGSIPSAGDPDTWIRLFQIVASNPILSQKLDVVKMFKFGARMAGAKNLNDFVRSGGNVNARVLPDEIVNREVEKGNMIPTNQAV